jgi:hypothetical protein
MFRGPVAKRLARGSLHPRERECPLPGRRSSAGCSLPNTQRHGGESAPYHRTVPTQTTQFAQFAMPYQEQLFRSL